MQFYFNRIIFFRVCLPYKIHFPLALTPPKSDFLIKIIFPSKLVEDKILKDYPTVGPLTDRNEVVDHTVSKAHIFKINLGHFNNLYPFVGEKGHYTPEDIGVLK